MAGVQQPARFLFCLFVYIFLSVQLLLWIAFSLTNLPSPESTSEKARTDCQCPKLEPATCEGAPEGTNVTVVPSSDIETIAKRDVNHYLLVIIILSSVDAKGRARRDIIRQTWMKSGLGRSLLVKFSVGTLSLSPSDHENLLEEMATYHDLLLLPNLQEAYTNLTRKVLESFVWVDEHLHFSYLMKCDDDTFVILDTVLRELSERDSDKGFYWGFFDGRATPKRDGKWTEKEWFLCDHYLPYALGGGYVVSSDLVHKIAVNADGLEFYNNEDVSVGVWLSPFRAERRHDVRFNTEYVSRGCRNEYIVSHKQSIDDMRSKHVMLQMKGVQCESEYQSRPSYEYNWNEVPSRCCERKKGIL